MSVISSPEFQAKVADIRRNRRLPPSLASPLEGPIIEGQIKGIADLATIQELGREIAKSVTSAGVEKNLNLFATVAYKRFRYVGAERSRIGFMTNGWLVDDVNPVFPTGGQWFNDGSAAFGRSLGADGSLYRHSVPASMSEGCGLIAYQVIEDTYAGMTGEQHEIALHREITRLESSLAEFAIRTHLA